VHSREEPDAGKLHVRICEGGGEQSSLLLDKEHRYWSIVENIRVGWRVRHVLYLGEIKASQELAWRKSIEVLEESTVLPRTLALFPEDRCDGLLPDESIVRLKLSDLRLCRPRQWGACWLAQKLWHELELDSLLGQAVDTEPQGHPLGPGAVHSSRLPVAITRIGVAALSAMV
jgi:hypothetical protein